MTNRINEMYWLAEMDIPAAGGQPDPGAGGPPTSMPGGPGDPMAQNPGQLPPQGGGSPVPQQEPMEEPDAPDMPDMGEDVNFETWKKEYMKASVKGDPNVLLDMIGQVRDKELDPNPRKFVEDNLQVCFLRQHQDFLIPSKKLRTMVKDQLDRTAPGTSLIQYLTQVLDESPLVAQILLKLPNTGGGKGDYHRKFLAAMLGAVQVGSGAGNEDLVYNEKDYSILVSTRFNTRWGDVNLGRWSMKEDDAQRYLKPAELQRLEGGSPEERDVLRRRVVMESISETFKLRAYLINAVSDDGTIGHLGLDLGNCLRAAYTDGKLVVRTKDSDARSAFIDEEGQVVPIPDMNIYYVKQAEDMDEKGQQDTEEIEFIAYRDGNLYLTAQPDVLKEAASTLQGLVYKETPFQGNPTDLVRISRCVPSAAEVLMKQC
jgi:hypothetical protein